MWSRLLYLIDRPFVTEISSEKRPLFSLPIKFVCSCCITILCFIRLVFYCTLILLSMPCAVAHISIHLHLLAMTLSWQRRYWIHSKPLESFKCYLERFQTFGKNLHANAVSRVMWDQGSRDGMMDQKLGIGDQRHNPGSIWTCWKNSSNLRSSKRLTVGWFFNWPSSTMQPQRAGMTGS